MPLLHAILHATLYVVEYNTPMQTDVRHFIELLWAMTEKELRARYKNTIFGFVWLIVNPLLQMLVIGFIFNFFMNEPIKNYFFHLFIGLLSWNFFSTSITKATPSVVFERGLIKKAAFPVAVIPLSIILSNIIHFAIAFGMLLVPVFFLGTMTMLTIPLTIAALLTLFMFTIGLSLMTCALNVRYRDVNFFIQALLIIWFYATPIVYSLSQIPPGTQWLWNFNPFTTIIQLLQHALILAAPPAIGALLTNIAIVMATFFLGIYVFNKEAKNFDDWV